MTLTTDEWTDKFFSQFASDIECVIGIFTELDGETIYTVRRHIMQCLRQGHTNMGDIISTNRLLRRRLIETNKQKDATGDN